MTTKQPSRPPLPSPRTIALSALEFLHAYETLNRDFWINVQDVTKDRPNTQLAEQRKQRIRSGVIKQTTQVSVVCLAFSIELFLKALILERKGGQVPRGHNLANLYGRLPADDKASLVNVTSTHHTQYFKRTLTDAQFSSELEKAADAFRQWRYIHEQFDLSFPTGVAFCLARALDDTLGYSAYDPL